MKKRRNKNNAMTVTLLGLSIALMFLFYMLGLGGTRADAAELSKGTLEDAGYYPGRTYGDYYDLTFAFDEYLKSIGAENVERFIYQESDEVVYELRFRFDDSFWKIKTNEYKVDLFTYGLFSSLEVSYGGVTYVIPVENCGTHISDATSPFVCDRLVFDAFHLATDKESEFRRELRAGLDEDNCPFMGLGIPHYEQEGDSKPIWHDDIGEFTVAEGLDLHY